ncbi:hypothetical protein Ocin01_14325 [Orchesella cincta]|uniref:Chitin-binding type-2 domain-containing protein n=1 Tax=Orchesella cincta TaxID=48709 RepID=A0A1D2MH74_ORCCI|nr:hypothetical protein Ocin01_14325 [Orchesella cincta]
MKAVVKALLALALVAIILDGTSAITCTKNGVYDCSKATPAADTTCDYYYCIWYPSLNAWMVNRYKCGTGFIWDDTIKRCITEPTTTAAPTTSA